MKTLLKTGALALLLSGCASTDDAEKQPTAASCVFPDAPTQAAPGWVCDEPVQGYELTSVGFAKKSSAGIGSSIRPRNCVKAMARKPIRRTLIRRIVPVTSRRASAVPHLESM